MASALALYVAVAMLELVRSDRTLRYQLRRELRMLAEHNRWVAVERGLEPE